MPSPASSMPTRRARDVAATSPGRAGMNLFSPRARPVRPVAGGTRTATPLWFGPDKRPLFGWVHAPTDGMARGAAVLCPPLFLEQDIAYYSFRRLAEELAARGVLAVRFDYDGTGDSAGGAEDPGRVRAWRRPPFGPPGPRASWPGTRAIRDGGWSGRSTPCIGFVFVMPPSQS